MVPSRPRDTAERPTAHPVTGAANDSVATPPRRRVRLPGFRSHCV